MTISYFLAKSLKEAGFPQTGAGNFKTLLESESTEEYYIPTLEEVLEALGERFENLERFMWEEGKVSWRAFMSDEAFEIYSKDYPCVKECCGYGWGDSPLEAVCNLWLSLKANK